MPNLDRRDDGQVTEGHDHHPKDPGSSPMADSFQALLVNIQRPSPDKIYDVPPPCKVLGYNQLSTGQAWSAASAADCKST